MSTARPTAGVRPDPKASREPGAAAPAGLGPRARVNVLRHFRPGGTGVEIGVFRGDYSRRILDVAKPAKLYLVDPWQNSDDPTLREASYAAGSSNDMPSLYEGVRGRFAAEIASGQVELCRGSSSDVMSRFDDESLDFVYIDGDHRYEGALVDMEMALAKVVPVGIIALDDYGLGGWWKGGVAFAAHDFLGRHAKELVIVMVQAKQVVLRKLRQPGGRQE